MVVGCCWTGNGERRVVVQPDRGERQILKLLGQLAVLRATGRAALSEVLAAESAALTRHSSLVVITPSTSTRWLAALHELRLRGVGSMAVLLEMCVYLCIMPVSCAMAAASGRVASSSLPRRKP